MKKLILRNFETNQSVDREKFTAVRLTRDQTGSQAIYQVKYFDEI